MMSRSGADSRADAKMPCRTQPSSQLADWSALSGVIRAHRAAPTSFGLPASTQWERSVCSNASGQQRRVWSNVWRSTHLRVKVVLPRKGAPVLPRQLVQPLGKVNQRHCKGKGARASGADSRGAHLNACDQTENAGQRITLTDRREPCQIKIQASAS